MLIAIVIPSFNEGRNVGVLMDDIYQLISVNADRYHFYLVDNGSTDQSFESLGGIQNDRIRICKLKTNQGYGGAIKFGLKCAADSGVEYCYYGWIHADRQVVLSEALVGINSIIELGDVDAGAGVRSAGLLQYCQSRLFDGLISLRFGKLIYDCNAQPKFFHSKHLERFYSTCVPNDFSFDLYWWFIFCCKLEVDVRRFKIKFNNRTDGVAKGGGGSMGSRLRALNKCLQACDRLKGG